MWDNTSPKRSIVQRIALLVGIVVLVLAVVAVVIFRDRLNLDSLRRWVKYMNVSEQSEYGSYTFDAHSSNCYAEFDGGLAVASVGGLNTYDESGGERYVLQQQLTLPQLQVQGKLALAYDAGGKSLLLLHKSSGEVLRLEENRPILDADLSESGQLCVSSSASGYKSVLSVYGKKQKLIYRWLSSTAYLPLCAMSPSGKELAAVSLGQEDGVFESSVCLFRTDSDEQQGTIPLGSQLIYDLYYVDDETLCAVGETAVEFVTTAGESIGSYSYTDRYLKDFHQGGSGFLTLSLNMYRAGSRYSLVTLDYKGNVLGEEYIGKEVLDLSACGRYVAVLTPQSLTIYTSSLEVYHETVETGSATNVVMREDGSVLLLGSGQGRLYIP